MIFLQALACKNVESRPPVWLMRQAGRYMPDYQKLRSKYSLWQLFHTPEIACEVTMLPMKLLDVDAAILFSDILVVAEMLGKTIVFPEKGGPKVEPPLNTPADVENLVLRPALDTLGYVAKTIALLKPVLEKPLIGFCGGPFTLATYMIGGVDKAINWVDADPISFHKLLGKITLASIEYLRMQIEAGVDAVQIFDSWAGTLPLAQFKEFACTYLQEIVENLRSTGIPIILFSRNSSVYHEPLIDLRPHGISYDGPKTMGYLRKETPSGICVQGNIAPETLLEDPSFIRVQVAQLLDEMRGEPGFIANLAHGVLPETPLENVRLFVDLVKEKS